MGRDVSLRLDDALRRTRRSGGIEQIRHVGGLAGGRLRTLRPVLRVHEPDQRQAEIEARGAREIRGDQRGQIRVHRHRDLPLPGPPPIERHVGRAGQHRAEHRGHGVLIVVDDQADPRSPARPARAQTAGDRPGAPDQLRIGPYGARPGDRRLLAMTAGNVEEPGRETGCPVCG